MMFQTFVKRPKSWKYLLMMPTLVSLVLWVCNLDNIQQDSQTEQVNLKKFVPLGVYQFLPVLWCGGHYLALIGLFIPFIAQCLNKRMRTFGGFACLFLWAVVFALHFIDLKGPFAVYIGLYKEDLFTLQFVTTSCLTLVSFSLLILRHKRKHVCHSKKNKKLRDTSAVSDILSNCTSFACSQCSCSTSGCKSNGAANCSVKDLDTMDENSPSRILGAKLSSLNLGSMSGGNKSCETNSIWSSSSFGGAPSSTLTRRPKTAALLAPARFLPSKSTISFSSSIRSGGGAASDKWSSSRDRRNFVQPPSVGHRYPKSECGYVQPEYGFPGGYGYGSESNFSTLTAKRYADSPESCYKSFWTTDEDTVSLLSGSSSSKLRRLTPIVKTDAKKNTWVNKSCLWKTAIASVLFCSLMANFVIFYCSFYANSFSLLGI